MSKNIKLLQAILDPPQEDGLLSLLDKKDKALSQYYDLQHDLRRGFMLAEDIVKEWAQKHYPLPSTLPSPAPKLKSAKTDKPTVDGSYNAIDTAGNKTVASHYGNHWHSETGHPIEFWEDDLTGAGVVEQTDGNCNHEWVEYKQCCYCGATENHKGEVIEKIPQGNVENLRQSFSDWYLGIKEQTGCTPLAMQIFFWFDKQLGIFNTLAAAKYPTMSKKTVEEQISFYEKHLTHLNENVHKLDYDFVQEERTALINKIGELERLNKTQP